MDSNICSRCGKLIGNQSYTITVDGLIQNRHLRCLLTHKALLKRSGIASAVVGSILLFLNQGDFILSGQFHFALICKAPLTYLVPFSVATWGAVSNSKRR